MWYSFRHTPEGRRKHQSDDTSGNCKYRMFEVVTVKPRIVEPLTVAITPLTIEDFNAMGFTLPAEFDDIFPPDGPDPAERKYKYLNET